jgi:hypothetical protein
MLPTDKLFELIRKKHDVLLQLRDMGLRQSELVKSGEISGLLKLLGAKQHVIAGLQELESGLKPYYAENPDARIWRSPADRAQCAQIANNCNTLLEEVVKLERNGAEQMDARRNDVAAQLNQVHAASQVRNAYSAQRRSIA